MSHTIIITQRVATAVKSSFTGDNKWVSLAVAVIGAIAGGWFF